MNGAMIAFLPTDGSWCRQSLPHMTLVYAGTTDELQSTDFNDLGKDALVVARSMRPFALDVTGVEVFGDEEKVDVLTLYPSPQLLTARRLVEKWNKSEHPFNAHATIGPEGSAEGMLPSKLYFDRIHVGWGNQNMVFALDMHY